MFVFKHNSIMYLLVYVDDLILSGNYDTIMTTFINRLYKEFGIKDFGNLKYFPGLEATSIGNGLDLR